MRKLATVATIVVTGLLAAGCRGGAGGTPALQGSVTGPAVVGAQVNVIEIDGTGAFVRTIGQLLTGQGGVFQSDLEIGGPMRLEVPNGFFVDPVTGQSVSIAVEGGLLRAFIPGRGAYSITALTTLAAQITQGSIDDGQPISKAIEDALSLIGDAFEVTDSGSVVRFDALRTSVADLTTSGTAPLTLTPETLYATILAGLSQYAATLNTQAGVATGTISLVDLLGELVKDAKDGSIDGVDASGSAPVNLTLSGVPIVPNGKTFGVALGEAITQVEPSLAGLSSQMASTTATSLGQSGDGGTVLLGPTQPTIATVSSTFAGTPNQAHWSGGDQVTITGTNFQASAQVFVGVPGGSSVAATNVLLLSGSQLTAKLAADTNVVTADTGLRSITVVNPNGTAATALQALQLVGPPASGLFLQLTPSGVDVDAGTTITGTSTTPILDANNRRVLAGEKITLSGLFTPGATAAATGDAPALQVSGASTTTDALGNIAFTVTPGQRTGSYKVTGTGSAGASSNVTLTIAPGAATAITLSPSATQVVANGTDTVTFTGTTVRDQHGNGVADGTSIALSTTMGTLSGAATSSSSGTIDFTFTAPASVGTGSAMITATVGTATDTQGITLVPGAPATVTFGASASSLSADGTGGLPDATSGAFSNAGQISGTVTDANGNRVGVLALTVTSSGPVLATGSFQTTATGSFTFDVHASSVIGGTGAAAQSATVFVTAQGATTAHALLVYPGAGQLASSSFTTPTTFGTTVTTSLVAGSVTAVKGAFADAFGNEILDGTVVSVSNTNAGSTVTSSATIGAGGATAGAGQFAFDYQASTTTGSDTLTVQLVSADGTTTTLTAWIDIVPDVAFSFDPPTLLTTSTTLSVDGSNGPQKLQFSSTLRDQHGNPVQAISVLAAATTDLQPASQTYNTDASGIVSVEVRASASSALTTATAGQAAQGTVTLTVIGTTVSTSLSVTINPGAPAAFDVTKAPGTPFTADIADFRVEATLKDVAGNAVLDETSVTVTSTEAVLASGSGGSATSSLTVMTTSGTLAFYVRLRDASKDPTITLTSGAARSTIGPIEVVEAVADTIAITDDGPFRAARLSVDNPDSKGFTVLVKDVFGNPVPDTTVNLVVGDSAVGAVSATSTKTNAAGLLSAVFTARTKAATTTVSASVAGGSGTLTTTTVATVVEGALKALAFTATTAQDSPLLVNEEAGGAQVEYKGTAVDQYGNPVGLQGTVSFTAEILGTTGVLAVGVGSSTAEIAGFSTSTYSGTVSTTDGTFVFYLRGVTKSGPLSVKVHDASGTISDTSPSETFKAGEAAAITSFGFTGASSVVVGQTLSGLTGTVKDRFGNLVDDGTVVDLLPTAASAGFTTSTFSDAAPTTTASGDFSADFVAGTEARTETISATARGLDGLTSVASSTASTTVTILPGTPDAAKSGFALRNAAFPVNDPPHLTADDTCQVTIVNTATLTDAYGNVVQDGEVFDVTIEPSATTGRPTAPATATRLAGGNLSVLATAGTATGTFTLTVTSHASTTQSASISLTLEPMAFARAGADSGSALKPTLVGLADLDHDGNLDLVEAATGTSKTVFVSFGDGAGGFSATTTSGSLSGSLRAFTLADLEPDGDVDLVAATGAGIETLRFARTTRSFAAATTVTSTPTNDVQVADIDRDGVPDIVGLRSSEVVVLTGAGTSTITYTTAATVSVGTGVNSRLAVGDITSSGWPDVVVIDGTDLYVIENDNAGDLSTIAPTQIPAAGATSLALADIDRDGDLDVVLGLATTGGGGKVRVRRNTGSSGSGGASRFTTTFDLTAPAGIDMGAVHDVAVGKVDRNGKPDIVCAFADSMATTLSRVGVFFQDDAGNALFTRPMIPVFSFDLRPGSTVALGDLDHDGVLDLAAAVTELCPPASSRTGASVALGLGDALSVTFADGVAVSTTAPAFTRGSSDVTDIASADVYLDGGDDIVIVRGLLTTPFSTTTAVEVHDYLHGAEVTATSTAIVGSSDRVTVRVRVADMNRDGAPDLVFHTVTGTAGAAGWTSTKNRVEYPINLGGGLFEDAPGVVTTTTPPGSAAEAKLLAVGPFARGGGPDAIVKLTASKEIRVAVGSGTSTPSVVVTSTAGFAAAILGGDPGRAARGDFNADGAVDLAVGVRDAFRVYTRLSVLYGDPADTDGDGDFFLAAATSSAIVVDNVQTIFTGYDAGVAGDFDNNGVDDVALLSSARVDLFSPKPTSTAEQARWDALAEIFTLGVDPTAIAAADFNRDGNLDLVVAQTVGPDAEIRVFLGDGAGLFTEKYGTAAGSDALLSVKVSASRALGPVRRIITPDLNQDGRPDIVVAQNGQVTVFLSTGVQGSSGAGASARQAAQQDAAAAVESLKR